MHRRRPHVLLSLALTLPIFVSSIAFAQDGSGSSSTSSGPAQPPAAAPARPPLVTAPAATSGAPASPPAPVVAPASPPPAAPSAESGPVPVPAPPPPAEPAAPVIVTRGGVSPSRDQQELAAQGNERPTAGDLSGQQVFSEDWWGRARPVIEVHGYFRTRAELFHNFFLGRHSSSLQNNDPQYLWPVPLDQSYQGVNSQQYSVALCGPNQLQNCFDKTESGANMRFRLDPEIDISDNLRIVSQIDLLDNVVLGSTPDSYANQAVTNQPTTTTTNNTVYQPAGQYNAYAPVGFFSTTQGTPTAGVNSPTNSISVKRVWAEYMTPVGQVRFGRMPSQWGLGMVDNSGDTLDSDYQTTVDRIMFVTGIRSMDLYFGGAWDYVSTGPTALPGATTAPVWDVYGGQPYNTCNLCNVNEWAAWAAHRTNPELQRLSLSRGDVVVNGGLYAKFRSQELDVANGTTAQSNDPNAVNGRNNGLEARHAWSFTPDLWVQILWQKLRIEAEGAYIWGEIGDLSPLNQSPGNFTDIREFGLAAQVEYRALEDKLRLQFDFGYASGDPWANNNSFGQSMQNQGALQPPNNGVQNEFNTFGPMSTFRFHPDYRVDLIFFRNILTRVEGAYFFKPTVTYDFIRHPDGEKLGGGASVIWSRASQFVQTPGHQSDLGVELDAQLYYQSKDGSLNDDPSKVGGFFTKLEYGVFFPLGGLNYLGPQPFDVSLSAAQIVRLYLGAVF
jgi:uncharacterized protein (TIGR04551 family)